MGASNILECDGLYHSYGDTDVLKGTSFSICDRESVVLQGYSGCGKTTLLRCLLLLEEAKAGRIHLAGKIVFDPKNKSVAVKSKNLYPTVGAVFQKLYLWPNLTCERNILLSSSKEQLPKQREYAHQLARKLNVGGVMSKFPNQTSLGQQQRIALIRALVCKPELLLLDEVTSALDPKNSEAVSLLLKSLIEKGMSTLAITHNSEFAKQLGARVMQMDNGVVYD